MNRAAAIMILAAALCVRSGPATANTPQELRGLVEAARPAGCDDYQFLFWDFYRAELWSDAARLPGERFALALTYRAEFTREELVESSIEEMARMSGRPDESFGAVRRELQAAFRDVTPGDRITAWRAAPDRLALYLNGAETGAVTQDTALFLDIWLGEKTRNPKGRAALLSGRCDG